MSIPIESPDRPNNFATMPKGQWHKINRNKEHVKEYRRKYAAWRMVNLYHTPEMAEKLDIIKDHPNLDCVKIHVLYCRLHDFYPRDARQSHARTREIKMLTLEDVISYLDSISYGVIR